MKNAIIALLAVFVIGGIVAAGATAFGLGPMQDQDTKDTIRQAIEDNDFDAWKSAMMSMVTEENFAQIVERHAENAGQGQMGNGRLNSRMATGSTRMGSGESRGLGYANRDTMRLAMDSETYDEYIAAVSALETGENFTPLTEEEFLGHKEMLKDHEALRAAMDSQDYDAYLIACENLGIVALSEEAFLSGEGMRLGMQNGIGQGMGMRRGAQ